MSRGKGHIPIRTCICCGAKRGKKDLIRLALVAGVVVQDISGQLKGRGAYVCADKSCLIGLKTSKRLSKAFRTGNKTVYGRFE
jgi:predicted RNA-binding protein YlxR (DUF448 family)